MLSILFSSLRVLITDFSDFVLRSKNTMANTLAFTEGGGGGGGTQQSSIWGGFAQGPTPCSVVASIATQFLTWVFVIFSFNEGTVASEQAVNLR